MHLTVFGSLDDTPICSLCYSLLLRVAPVCMAYVCLADLGYTCRCMYILPHPVTPGHAAETDARFYIGIQ